MGPGGVHAGKTKGTRIARFAAAADEDSTPEKVAVAPTANVVTTAAHGYGATSVPSTISAAPKSVNPA